MATPQPGDRAWMKELGRASKQARKAADAYWKGRKGSPEHRALLEQRRQEDQERKGGKA